MKKLILFLLFFGGAAFGQVVTGNGLVQYVTTAPSGACGQSAQQQDVVGTGTIYTCQSGTWTQIGTSNGATLVTSLASPTASSTAPSPLGSDTGCPAGVNPFWWIKDNAANYEVNAGLDTTTTHVQYSTKGFLEFCRTVIFNRSGIAPTFSMNGALDIFSQPTSTTDNIAMEQIDQTTSADATAYTNPMEANYTEFDIQGHPTVAHAGGEVSFGGLRGVVSDVGDASAAWSGPTAGVSGATFKNTTNNTSGCASSTPDCYIGGYFIFYNEVAGSMGTVNAAAIVADAHDATGGSVTGRGYGLHVMSPGDTGNGAYFSTYNRGIFIDSYGTTARAGGANNFDIYADGVNAAGTPAGFDAFVGPISFGTSAQAASGFQVDISGSTKMLTVTTATSSLLQLTQGANGPAATNAPAVINVTAAAAGGLATASVNGFTGAPITFLTGAGSAGGATTGNGGTGGAFGLTTGAGGAAGGTTTNNGGVGGAINYTLGAGAAGAATGAGGAAGAMVWSGGTGGAGGATSGTGGAGSDFLVTTGGGGAATAGSTTGRGGNAVFTLGSAGGTGTAGLPGQFEIVGGTVGAANTTPFLNLTGTWNTTGVVDAGIFGNLTCTAAAASSKALDVQIGGSTQLNLSFLGANCATPLLTSLGPVKAGVSGGNPGFVDTTVGVTTAAMGAQSSASCTNVTNMTWTIAANKNYTMHCSIPMTFAASATVAFCIGGPGSPTSHTINAIGSIGAAGVYDDINLVNSATYGTKTAASGAVGASTQIIVVDATIRNGATASGTALTLQTAANGTNNITVLADASCSLTQDN